jgi:hypothetical protein
MIWGLHHPLDLEGSYPATANKALCYPRTNDFGRSEILTTEVVTT